MHGWPLGDSALCWQFWGRIASGSASRLQTHYCWILHSRFYSSPGGSVQYKIICFNPSDSVTDIDGFNPRQFAPAFLINIADRKELGKAHKIMMGTKYFDKMSDTYKKYLNI